MHLYDPTVGLFGTNGLVGGGIPSAVGAAISAKHRKTGDVAVAFFGDGATNHAAFHESLNFAGFMRAPVIFVCENNLYATATALSDVTLNPEIATRAAAYGIPGVAVDGTPADNVYVAINHLMKGQLPDLVLSGINHGPNLADDVIYSGTVAAAMEGCILGIPAIAFSLATRKTFEFEHAAKFAKSVVRTALSSPLPQRMLLNVNIPSYGPVKGYEVTRLGRHSYGASIIEKEDPRGRKYYWIGGTGYDHVTEEGTDVTVVHDHRKASITPLMLDLTQHEFIKPLQKWKLDW
jgi:5'-nucleotidase